MTIRLPPDLEQRRQKIEQLPAFIVLARKPGSNALTGLIEHSFSMDWSDERVNIFWSGTAYSILGKHEIDGQKDADYNRVAMAAHQPTWVLTVHDARADDCPVSIDWERWTLAMLSSGNKFYKRNALFVMK
jgi:hypothetical protein